MGESPQFNIKRVEPEVLWRKRRLNLYPALLFFSILTGSHIWLVPAFADQPTSLCVMNFTNRNPGEWDWLSKGMADMLITDLSTCDKFRIVERERMQMMFDEMNLSKRGVVNPETAQQFGRVMKADWAVFGSYLRKEGKIEIECHIVDVATQKLRRVEAVSGSETDVLNLEKRLALQIVGNFELPLTEEERQTLLRMSTRSVDAAQSYYDATDHYDTGDYISALMLFRQAVRYDTSFSDAYFRVGQMYYDLGEIEHSLVEFQRAAKGDVENYYTGIAGFIIAEIEHYYLDQPETAADRYLRMADRYPGTHLAVVAAFQAGQLLEEAGKSEEAYQAYQRIEELYRLVCEKSSRPDPWSRLTSSSLQGYNRIADKFCQAYFVLFYLDDQESLRLPEDSLFMGPGKNILEYDGSRPTRGAAVGPPKADTFRIDRLGRHTIVADRGNLITGLNISVRVKPASSTHRYCCVTAYDLKNGDQVGWTRVEVDNGRENVFVALKLSRPCFGINLDIIKDEEFESLSVDVMFSHISRARLARISKENKEIIRAEYPLPGIHELAAFRDSDDNFHVLVTESESIPQQGNRTRYIKDVSRKMKDIWRMTGKSRLGPFRKMRINSLYQDYHPSLAQDRTGRYWLVFCSRRHGKTGANLWLASSNDCEHWTYPRRVELDIEWPSLGPDAYSWEKVLRNPEIMIDRRGLFWLAFGLEDNVYLTNSEDGWDWRKPVKIQSGYNGSSIGLCEGIEDKAVVAIEGRYWHLKDGTYSAGWGIVIAEVASDLTFEKENVGKENIVQPKYGLSENLKLANLFRLPDGRFLLFGIGSLGKDYSRFGRASLYACLSSDLLDWEYHNLHKWRLYKLPAELPCYGPLVILPSFGEDSVILITVKPRGVFLQKVYLGSVLHKEETDRKPSS